MKPVTRPVTKSGERTSETLRTTAALLVVLGLCSLGCITMPWNQDDTPDRPDLSDLECGEFQGDEPMMGYFWDAAQPLSEACPQLPIEPGFQGGFHITPMVWVPIDSLPDQKTGVSRVTVTFIGDEVEPIELEREFFDDFWAPAGDGEALQEQVVLPNDVIGDGGVWPVQIDYTVDFDDPDAVDASVTRQTEIYL